MSDHHPIDRNMPILVVDDLSAMRRIVKNCLKQLGFENICEAEDAQTAMQHMQQQEFKFVISDWNLPNIDGAQFIHALQEQAGRGHVPVLVVAAEAHRGAALHATNGKEDMCCIVKPFTADLLQEKMEAVLGKF